MFKTAYNILLKGYVGSYESDRKIVDIMLASQSGKHSVNVLIDSLSDSLATGLSISVAFINHDDVSVHFVGLNASAATIGSLDKPKRQADDAQYVSHLH